MTSYEGFPGHENIREILEAQETDIEKSVNSSITSASSPSTPSTSLSSDATPGSGASSDHSLAVGSGLDRTSPECRSSLDISGQSSSSADNIPCAPPCSLSGSSENLTPNMDSTGKGS